MIAVLRCRYAAVILASDRDAARPKSQAHRFGRWAFVVSGGVVLHPDRGDPPSNWSLFPAVRLADEIYYGWPDGEEKPWIYTGAPLWATGDAPGPAGTS